MNLRPLVNVVDNVAAESATAAGRPALFRTQSAGSRISEGMRENPGIFIAGAGGIGVGAGLGLGLSLKKA